MKAKTCAWRLMQRYEAMKKSKGSGKSIIATARKVAVIIWHMLSEEEDFDTGKMVDRKPGKKSEALVDDARKGEGSQKGREGKPNAVRKVKRTGVARKKTKKIG